MRRVAGFAIIAFLFIGAWSIHRLQTRRLPHIQWESQNKPVGVFHVHSSESHDSKVSVDQIAKTAQGLQLDFVVITDHNAQSAPAMVNNTTLLSFAELSTKHGHVIQLGVPELVTKAEKDSLELGPLLKQRGGSAVIAHPTDPKRPWNGRWRDAGGLEIASVSSAARQIGGISYLGLLPTLAVFPINSRLALAQLYRRDDKALRRWDETLSPEQVGFCGVDAHGRINLRQNLRLWQIHLEDALPEALPKRAHAIVKSLKEGRFYCSAGLFGDSPEFRFTAQKGGNPVGMSGDTISEVHIDELTVTAPAIRFPDSKHGTSIVLFRNGEEILRHNGTLLRYPSPPPGTYRVEVRIPVPKLLFGYTTTPVIYSNKLRVTQKE